jgi:hypothetical protein
MTVTLETRGAAALGTSVDEPWANDNWPAGAPVDPGACFARQGEIDHYEAWLYAPRPETECEPDHYIFSWTRDEMLAEIDRLPEDLTRRIVVKAIVDGERHPVDPYGNALDADGISVVANAI